MLKQTGLAIDRGDDNAPWSTELKTIVGRWHTDKLSLARSASPARPSTQGPTSEANEAELLKAHK